jgi:hypothetical protein
MRAVFCYRAFFTVKFAFTAVVIESLIKNFKRNEHVLLNWKFPAELNLLLTFLQ